MIDFSELIRPGDFVVWGQACAEPVPLVEQLLSQRAELGGITCFIGIPVAGTVRPEHADHIRFVSYCGTGTNRHLAAAGLLDIYPGAYSTLPQFVSRADVVLVQCTPADEAGRYSLGLADDYLSAAIDSARVVVAEVNDQLPFSTCARYLTDADIDVVVHTSRSVPENVFAAPTADLHAIAGLAAELIPDGATLQFGIGAVPEAVLGALTKHRDLGIHSGIFTDAAVGLMEGGVVAKAVTTLLMGSARLFDFVDHNPNVCLCPISYTHDPERLAGQHKFVAINSAIEVDLTGQINAETAGGRYVGAVGGGGEFLRAAHRSVGGIPIVALPSTAGQQSRIVSRLSGPVTTARADAGVFVTEFGVADLRGLTLGQRRERMLAIAHPNHRDALQENA
ncbi:acetyl-CoA hydrolase/transferase family protein [Smaragdicoccus niigatensis]|uniref:acetyl-CoA hydrolase/transferase family protein n=1 Tax=Smaragdicoccus niigatensis TaxID=359359 RepID=UPI000362F021|nr:acetyl-CoA hydrolase/transferase C-terminal domain-containing protein [Smaragdicoccus niigatensis]